ncbi:Uncharacterized protein OBRU01_01691 [Operophtera brumata]|uniref:C2H2-type domain-containing protein n=1 Tax=Operophtera brumata TaxID=104452 RepID=A0A0L7LTL6_OPEBR|nr:Uncharacterized protein OBRU01_01691 [Operophtera brumata]
MVRISRVGLGQNLARSRTKSGERPYKCHLPDCGRAFIQLSNLQQHLRNHDAQVERAKNRPFHCNICGKGFATESSLRTHTAKQHAALMIGGASATPCPICHKVVFGGEALVEHMKNTHKDPNASGVASPPATSPYPAQAKPTDPYIAKRRTANHPCPVCGKHYVNEGSLRKHLACHPETQLTSSLRMWPCSVCQAVFTHESGLLTHMEHMRMDPKHQFAAQYVLSRAAAERRERDLLAAVSAGGSGLLNLAPPSPAHSDSSSNGRLSSSAGSEAGAAVNKLSDILRNNGHQAYGDERVAAIAAAAANMMAQPGEGANAVQVAAANLVSAMRQQLAGREQPPVQPPETPPAPSEAALRIQQAEALLRSQAEALRLAVSQAAAVQNEAPSPLRHNGGFPPQPNDASGQLSPDW